MLGRHVYRVAPDAGGTWRIRKDGEAEPRAARSSRDDAVAAALDYARADQPSRVVIEEADGTIAGEQVFGADPGQSVLER
jgi:hypothetical protein